MELFLAVQSVITLMMQLICMVLTYRALLKNAQLWVYLKERYNTFDWRTKIMYLVLLGSLSNCRVMTRLGSKWVVNLLLTATVCGFGFLALKSCPLIIFGFIYFMEVLAYHWLIATLYVKSERCSKWVASKFFDSNQDRTKEVVTFFLGNPRTGVASKGTIYSLVGIALYKKRELEEAKLKKETNADMAQSGVVYETIEDYLDSKNKVRMDVKANGNYPITKTEDTIKEWADYLVDSAKELFKKGTDN